MAKPRPALIFIFITLVLDILGIGLIVPILPSLVTQLKGGDAAAGAYSYGLLNGVYAFMQFMFATVIGALSDQFGRRKVILISLLGSGLDYFLMAWAPTLGWFFLGRVISGITGANFSAATAYIADISPREKRAANFGLVGAAFGFGFALGPALGGWLAAHGVEQFGENGIRLPFVAAGILALLNCLYGLFVLPESLQPENRRPFRLHRGNPLGAILDLRRYPFVLGLALTYFILSLGHQVFPAIWALYTEYRFQWDPREIGNSLALVGIMAIVIQGGVARKLIPRLGERRSAIIGVAINIAALVGYGVATVPSLVYWLIVAGSLGGIATPAIQGMISRSVGDDEQGTVQGSLASLQSVAGFLGIITMSSIFGFFISDRAPHIIPGAGFFFAATLTAIGLAVLIASLHKRHLASKE